MEKKCFDWKSSCELYSPLKDDIKWLILTDKNLCNYIQALGREFHLWESKAIIILQRALLLESVKFKGNIWRGTETRDDSGHVLHLTPGLRYCYHMKTARKPHIGLVVYTKFIVTQS